jgi:hypothetical protein
LTKKIMGPSTVVTHWDAHGGTPHRPCSSSPAGPVVAVEPPLPHMPDASSRWFGSFCFCSTFYYVHICLFPLFRCGVHLLGCDECAFRQVLAILLNLTDFIVFPVSWLRFVQTSKKWSLLYTNCTKNAWKIYLRMPIFVKMNVNFHISRNLFLRWSLHGFAGFRLYHYN